MVVGLLALAVSDADDVDDVSESRAETLPLCSRLQTAEKSSRLQRPIPVDDLWSYLARQKTVGYRDLKAEYEVCVSFRDCNLASFSLSRLYHVEMLYVLHMSTCEVLAKLMCFQFWCTDLKDACCILSNGSISTFYFCLSG